MFARMFGKKSDDAKFPLHRKSNLITQIDYILDTIENSKFDIVYMENLKNPLTPDEKIYFIQQIDRLESAKNVLLWLRGNVESNTSFWKKLLPW
jgi:hypothetical protein